MFARGAGGVRKEKVRILIFQLDSDVILIESSMSHAVDRHVMSTAIYYILLFATMDFHYRETFFRLKSLKVYANS